MCLEYCIISELKNTTEDKVLEAEKVKVTGAAGAYTKRFEVMEEKIGSVEKIIKSASVSVEELVNYQDKIEGVTEQLDDTTDRMENLDDSLAHTKLAILHGQYNLTILRQDADKLQQSASNVKDEATKLQEANVKGALVLTKKAKERVSNSSQKLTENPETCISTVAFGIHEWW